MVDDTTRHEQGTLEDDDVDGEDDSEDEVKHDSKKRKRGNHNSKHKPKSGAESALPTTVQPSPSSTAKERCSGRPCLRFRAVSPSGEGYPCKSPNLCGRRF
jgi:hypothetical protein